MKFMMPSGNPIEGDERNVIANSRRRNHNPLTGLVMRHKKECRKQTRQIGKRHT
jgi:hypothetical protein